MRTTGFTRHANSATALSQMAREKTKLSALADAVNSFQGDEEAFGFHSSVFRGALLRQESSSRETALTSYHWEWAHDNQECWISMNGRMSASETAGRNSERRT